MEVTLLANLTVSCKTVRVEVLRGWGDVLFCVLFRAYNLQVSRFMSNFAVSEREGDLAPPTRPLGTANPATSPRQESSY